jgi:colanic acid biosynthesis glycosyl transferase WcaI
MRILIQSLNYAPERIGTAVYSAGMAEALRDFGHAVRVVAGQPYYPAWRVEPGYPAFRYTRRHEQGIDVTRCPHYVPRRPTGIRRILHHASFALTSFVPLLRDTLLWRPDVVIAVAPGLMAAPMTAVLGRLGGARTWLHVQDFEAEAAVATGLMAPAGRLARGAALFERMAFSLFDRVSSISPRMCARLAAKGVPADRIFELRNWAELELVRPTDTPSPLRAEWNITTPYVALYSGNIANKQGISIVLDAAKRLADRDDLTFVVCGEGSHRAALQRRAEGLGNVRFFGLQPRERLGELLALATVHLLPQRADVADLVLPSKLTNMLASGRPVVATVAPGADLGAEIAGCGLATPPGDAAAFAEAIRRLIDDAEMRERFGRAARERAERVWARPRIMAAFHRELTSLGPHPAPAVNLR